MLIGALTDEEIRLFLYSFDTRRRYLYVSGAESLPLARRPARQSPYALHLAAHPDVDQDPGGLPNGLAHSPPRRRLEDADYPTSFTEIRYYLQCPKSYQFRKRYGLNPVVPEMFGYGKTVHTLIQKLHELHPDAPPESDQVKPVVLDTFHLKHVPQSGDPVNRPGAFENSRNRAVEIAKNMWRFSGVILSGSGRWKRSLRFRHPIVSYPVSIDLLLHEDENGNILRAEIIDFKAVEGGKQPAANDDLEWTELALQVQLYVRAADQVLGQNARTGTVHLLKDNQRVEVPISEGSSGRRSRQY